MELQLKCRSKQNYVLNPFIQLASVRTDGRIHIPFYGVELEANDEILKILKMYRTPTKYIQDIDTELFSYLSRCGVLLKEGDEEVMSTGLIYKDHTRSDCNNYYDIRKNLGKHIIFGAPFDSVPGCMLSTKQGPTLIRNEMHFPDDSCFADIGNIIHHPYSESLLAPGRRVELLVKDIIDNGCYPIILGGDHSISYFAIRSASSIHRNLGVIHFDAHTDRVNPRRAEYDYLTHASVMRHVSKLHNVKRIIQIGVREIFSYASCECSSKFSMITATELSSIQDGGLSRYLTDDLVWYLTFDADVFDSSIAPNVNYPETNGIFMSDVERVLLYGNNNIRIIGADFVEVCASYGNTNPTANLVANAIQLIRLG